MKTILIGILIFLIINFLFTSCQKFEFNAITKIRTDNSEIVNDSVKIHGAIVDLGKETHKEFGFCYSQNNNPKVTDDKVSLGKPTNIGSFETFLKSLNGNTKYYYNVYIINEHDTLYGEQKQFTSPILKPALVITEATGITENSAVSGGTIISDGGSAITARGICWSTSPNPTTSDSHTSDGTGTGSFTSNIYGLSSAVKYFVRAYATSSKGTVYSSQDDFITHCPSQVIDLDNNSYNIVQVGTQCWMKENLKTTKYRDNTAIPNVTDYSTWSGLSTGAYCNYNDTLSYSETYGKLYNWYACTDTNGLCPSGWHVPTDAEWTTLTDSLGGENIAGGKMKETGTTHWAWPNTDATNESGFTALPGGRRINNGSFFDIKVYGNWWTATQNDAYNAWSRKLSYSDAKVQRNNYSKSFGFSVRCIRD
ncbi:MAG: fibrobacter succinogenes major paralogous domain-containing protein [Bacteroidia bacterium]|nr:fibrobacter succinogenes major paralogous domain-containing protein [Bacteroidia bacterium]